MPVSTERMSKRGSLSVTIESSDDKRMIAKHISETFVITLSGTFLSMQLIYGGKTNQNTPRIVFPEGFRLSANPQHFSNTEESLKFFIDEFENLNDERSKL